MKGNKDVIALLVYHNFNNSLPGSSFPTALKYNKKKMAKIKKLDGKDDRSDKESYRPISILPNKIVYERLV